MSVSLCFADFITCRMYTPKWVSRLIDDVDPIRERAYHDFKILTTEMHYLSHINKGKTIAARCDIGHMEYVCAAIHIDNWL